MTEAAANPLSRLPKREADRIASRVDVLMERGGRMNRKGRVTEAVRAYREAIKLVPWYSGAYYDLGLVYKYARRWRESLKANLKALEGDPDDEAAAWNAGIAATAIADWKTARAMWKSRRISLPGRSGDPAGNLGPVVVRLNPEGVAETVWARRVCPVRAVIVNVPLPESGYRCGDIVLHDGAPQGMRSSADREYPVFNVLQRLVRSAWRTYGAEVEAASHDDIEALETAGSERLIRVEDWTESVRTLCLRCSYGVPHRHGKRRRVLANKAWQATRSIGIAARTRADVDALLDDWQRGGESRRVERVFSKTPRRKPSRPRLAWWSYEDFARDNG